MQKFRYSPEALLFIAKKDGSRLLLYMVEGQSLDIADTIQKLQSLSSLQSSQDGINQIHKLIDVLRNNDCRYMLAS